ncbi:glucose-1-phosphate thymidylyltransferase RfbA [Cysteiniphilum sp. JM-1]|uniref:glucose-1-phosphate thymidylyltransferase RfbA n=1 Tax=Cysteiniphilum TaxID=2056696 RepID=UPI001244D06E|nr:glucose-1-phosphate thymidylyltransferase RfbA [Cysteiniphilum sp. JM-1]
MKGIILAGGSGTRLYPATLGVSKQLIPVYDKPMIYYPLSVLMLAGIKEIAVITTEHDQAAFQRLLQDGSQWGVHFEYIVQPSPDGLAQAFILAEDFLAGDSACLVLGDNIYFGHGLPKLLIDARSDVENNGGAQVFAYWVSDPERYGVVEFDENKQVLSVEEKPKKPKSNYAVTGLYFYDADVCKLAKEVKPSDRGELEISSLNDLYFKQKKLNVQTMGRGYAWLDTGTHESMMEASRFVSTIEHRQGLKIGCPEEIAYHNGWIDKVQVLKIAKPLSKTHYGKYLKELVN